MHLAVMMMMNGYQVVALSLCAVLIGACLPRLESSKLESSKLESSKQGSLQERLTPTPSTQ